MNAPSEYDVSISARWPGHDVTGSGKGGKTGNEIGNKTISETYSGAIIPHNIPINSVGTIENELSHLHAWRSTEQQPEIGTPTRSHHQTDNFQTPIISGITLVSTHTLPDRFRNVFDFPLFNAIQSKCFDGVYNTGDNHVLSSPTGSGKTVIFELAICRLVNTCAEGSFKIVYQAPTRSLCSERQRDWQLKFAALNLQVAELTGDIPDAQLRNVQHAALIITTPEKWDSITRKWKDHKKLMHMVKLFLIDEVHTLKDDRGAVLEVVVSRMKSVGSNVRFIALSATIPNIDDISAWLGKSPHKQHMPAQQQVFGEEFRPVRMTRHVCGYLNRGNKFAFDKALNEKLPEAISKYSAGKPILVFCFTRAACFETAKYLAEWWLASPRRRYWQGPTMPMVYEHRDLQDTANAGVAFHHAGLSAPDRAMVEKNYLSGNINVICCTSTLAAGVNLPCHMVIIKNTITYNHGSGNGCKEYSDLEIVQMLGRAGRPQFDDSAVAIIMTRQQQVSHYERLVSGEEAIESRLHLNLIDHLNAEIGLGTIHDRDSATAWLCSTFLYVRLKKNPQHYKLSTDRASRYLEEHLQVICDNGIGLLQKHDLVTTSDELQATAFGQAMSRYCVHFETMQTLTSLGRSPKMTEILTAISKAAEFKDVYFRSGEKVVYRQWDNNPLIKFPLKIHVDAPWHKVFLIIQVVLAGSELIEAHRDLRQAFNSARTVVFQHALRLLKCICDCLVHANDGIGTRNALTLARSITAHIWDDSILHMSQLEGLGVAGVRRLTKGGIKSVEDISEAEPHRLEQIMSRHPPYGTQLRDKALSFPRMSIILGMNGKPIVQLGEAVVIAVIVKLSFLNERPPTTFRRKSLQICLLLDTMAGDLLHFSRFSATQMAREPVQSIKIHLTRSTQAIRGQVMCDDYAGTVRTTVLKLNVPESIFHGIKTSEHQQTHERTNRVPRTKSDFAITNEREPDDYGDSNIHDQDLIMAEDEDFLDLAGSEVEEVSPAPGQNKKKAENHNSSNGHTNTNSTRNTDSNTNITSQPPIRLDSGKWNCRHACKDKTACKHLCCREGLDHKPKVTKARSYMIAGSSNEKQEPQQTQLRLAGNTSTNAFQAVQKKTTLTTMNYQHTSSLDDTRIEPDTATWSIAHGLSIDLSSDFARPPTPDDQQCAVSTNDSHPTTSDIFGAQDYGAESQTKSPTAVGQLHDSARHSEAGNNVRKYVGKSTDSQPSPRKAPPEMPLAAAVDSVRQFLGDDLFNYVN